MKTSIRIHIVALLVALAMPISASAWMKSICSGNGEELDWDNETTQIRFSSVSFPAGSYRDGLDTAIDRWNENPSDFDFTNSFGDTSIDFSSTCPGLRSAVVTKDSCAGVISAKASDDTDDAGSVSSCSEAFASAAVVPDGITLPATSTVTACWPATARASARLT